MAQSLCSCFARLPMARAKRFVLLFAASVALPGTLMAQPGGRSNDVTAADLMLAQHSQWEADHQKWRSEHLEMADRLEAIMMMLRTEQPDFAADMQELEEHGRKLREGGDRATMEALVADHVRVAEQHDKAALAHHELLGEVARFENLLTDDRGAETLDEER